MAIHCQICKTFGKPDKCHVVDDSYAIRVLGWTKMKSNTHNIVHFCRRHHELFDRKRQHESYGSVTQFIPHIITDYLRKKFIVYNEDDDVFIEYSWPSEMRNEVDVYEHYFDWKNARCHELLIPHLRKRGLPLYDVLATPEEIRDGAAENYFEIY